MKILIAGGGIGGLTTAIALQQKGFDVTVFEQASEIKPLGAGLGMGANAVKVFDTLGLKTELMQHAKLLAKASILDENGRKVTFSDIPSYGLKDCESISIHRADLHRLLLDNLQSNTLVLGKSVADVKQQQKSVTLLFTDGTSATGDCLIAADGIHSAVRKKILSHITPRFAGYTCWRGVIDQAPADVPADGFIEYWGSRGRFGIVPLPGNKIYWFACINAKAQDPVYKKFRVHDLQQQFAGYPQHVQQILSFTKDHQLLHNDIIDLKPLKKFAFGRILLTGDAAHATTPNLGQGACQAIEDALYIAKYLISFPSIEEAFVNFEKKRIPRTTRIVNTSWQIGKMAQLRHPVSIALRNAMLRLLPPSLNKKQLKQLVEINI